MKIIVINDHGSAVGGAAQVAISSLNGLARTGNDVTFISAVGPISPHIDQKAVEVICLERFDLLGNPSRLSAAVNGLWDRKSALEVKKILSRYKPEDTIVHLHTWVKSLSSSVPFEIMRMGFRLVCTLHDYFSCCPNGGFYNYKSNKHCEISPMTLKCLSTNCDSRSYFQKVWRFSRQIIQQKLAKVPREIPWFISVSDYSEVIIKPYLHREATVFRVSNPIDVQKASPARPSENSEFLFVGRLSPEKGASLFARAAHMVGVSASFVGSGIEEARIKETLPKARFFGWRNRTDVFQIIANSRAIVVPSLWHETQGLVVLEAAALGIPAIVSRKCAAAEYIEDGKNGILFESGNCDDLAGKLKTMLNDNNLISRLGLEAYNQYWSKPCTVEGHVCDLLKCYQLILESKLDY
jgi:glycosyltransferase involved in cell wall biosynthesis